MPIIIIPAFNEEARIGRVVRGLFEHGFRSVIVVDDGSTDKTGFNAKVAGARIMRHEINRGQGAALETGNEYARQNGAEIVVHFDGDGQHNSKDVISAIKRLEEEKLDIVLGSRFLDSRSKIPWLKRYVILPISRWINYVFTGIWLSDAHNGFRVFNKRALDLIQIKHDGMAHNSEIVAQIKNNNLRFAEHPVEVIYHEYGQGMKDGFKIIYDFLIGHFVG